MHGWTLVDYEKYLIQYGDSTLTNTFEYDGSNNLIFMGRTPAGRSKSEAQWQIKKFTYDVDGNLLDIQWAEGTGNFDKIWNDRDSFEYS